MPWNQSDYPPSMKNLPDATRNKAIQIANALLKSGKDDGEAIRIGISQAEKWAGRDKIADEVVTGLAKLAEFREDHWEPKEKKSHKKEIAEDVMLGGLGAKVGAGVGGVAGLAAGKKTPLEHPATFEEVKTRQARKLVNSALHNHQAKWSGVKGGTIGAGLGLGLAGAGMLANHLHHQEKTAGEQKHPIEVFPKATTLGAIGGVVGGAGLGTIVGGGGMIGTILGLDLLSKNPGTLEDLIVPTAKVGAGIGALGGAIAGGRLANQAALKKYHQEKTAAEHILPRELTLYGVLDALFHHRKTASENPDIPNEHQSHHTFGKGTFSLIGRTANPSTRHEMITEIFSNNPMNRYDNISPIPLLFGKKKGEEDILKPKKNVVLDIADKGGHYHPIMQGTAKHWAETGRGMHAKKL